MASRQTVCWACKGRPDPRPCPERLPAPRSPTEPTVAERRGEPSTEPGTQRSCYPCDKAGTPAHRLTTKSPRDAAPQAEGQARKGLLEGWDGPNFSRTHPGRREGSQPTCPVGKTEPLREGRRPPGVPTSPPLSGAPGSGWWPESRAESPEFGGLRAETGGRGCEDRAGGTHHGGRRSPFQTAGGRFAAGPWLGHHLGREGEGRQAAAAAELAWRSLSPAPPRACYINRRRTMSPNFVVGI